MTTYSNWIKPVLSGAIVCGLTASAVILSPSIASTSQDHVATGLAEINVNDGFANLVEAVKPAVVNISTTTTLQNNNFQQRRSNQQPELEEFFKRFFGEQFNQQQGQGHGSPTPRKSMSAGSGFIIDPDGLVVTNYHVIEGADEIEVVFDDGQRIPATVKGTDKKTDLALLEIETENPLPYVVFGDSESARIGDWVVAIGNPFGLGGTTTKGIISARGRDIQSGPLDDFIQIDAPINRGNSGGPLFNTKGEVIGVNSAIYSPNGGSVGIGFAIPSSMASNVIAQIDENGVVQRGFLGVQIQAVSDAIGEALGLEKAQGALVTEVIEESPAEAAGIEAGDVILSFDDKAIDEMRDLPKIVALTPDATQVDVEVWRNNKVKNLKVSVGTNADSQLALSDTSPSKNESEELGLALSPLTNETRREYGIEDDVDGVLVTNVLPESTAAQAGIKSGDIIKRVGSDVVNEPEEVTDAVKDNHDSDQDSVLLLVERGDHTRYVVVPMNS